MKRRKIKTLVHAMYAACSRPLYSVWSTEYIGIWKDTSYKVMHKSLRIYNSAVLFGPEEPSNAQEVNNTVFSPSKC